MHLTLAQSVSWIAMGGGAWAIIRAATTKGLLKARTPARCAACGRRRSWGRCPCTGP